MGEFDFIRWIGEQSAEHPGVTVGIGDDCAVLAGRDETIVTTDMLLDGRHFHLDRIDPRRAGRKSLGVNLSDLAAMGAVPTAAFLSLALPRRDARRLGEAIVLGVLDMAREFDVPLAGGDTNTWDGPAVVSITALGRPGPAGPILRSGAKPGDWILVTGSFGGSLRGKHLDFTPRVRESLILQEHCRPHAMIDVSDGLAADLGHVAQRSGCGIALFADRIPISDDAMALASTAAPLDRALGDGEDFELAFAVAPEEGRRLLERQPLADVSLTWVGVCLEEPGLFLETAGRRAPLAASGFQHEFGRE